MSIVSNLITQSLRNNGLSTYESHAEPVARDLQDALDRAVESLVSGGVSLGASREQVEGLLIDAGLKERPAPAPVEEEDVDLASTLRSISQQIDSLVGFARQHGFRA